MKTNNFKREFTPPYLLFLALEPETICNVSGNTEGFSEDEFDL